MSVWQWGCHEYKRSERGDCVVPSFLCSKQVKMCREKKVFGLLLGFFFLPVCFSVLCIKYMNVCCMVLLCLKAVQVTVMDLNLPHLQ